MSFLTKLTILIIFNLRMREFKKFHDVSILYADICNFTPLTTTLEPYQLVQTLNDLFGKFDDAAEASIFLSIPAYDLTLNDTISSIRSSNIIFSNMLAKMKTFPSIVHSFGVK